MLSLSITIISAIALLTFVLILSLLFIGGENVIFHIQGGGEHFLDPLERALTRHCGDGNCPPTYLYASCTCLLFIFLFIPMGALPQFISTDFDLFIILFLLLAAQGFYIRGIKLFSKELYQSLDRSETNLLFKFTVAMLTIGGTFSWYVLNRGMPGNIFSLDSYAAMPMWEVVGDGGVIGMCFFFLLLAVTSPCRRTKVKYLKDNVPLPEIFDAVRSTICPAIIAAIFLPQKAGLSLGFTDLSMYAVDFICFWWKVFILQVILIPWIREGYLRCRAMLPENWKLAIVIFLGFAGVAFMMGDLYCVAIF